MPCYFGLPSAIFGRSNAGAPAGLVGKLCGGPTITLSPAYRGMLLFFSPLELGPDPRRGDAVHVTWIDRLQPIPTTAETTGMVENTSATSPFCQSVDFAPVFSVASSSSVVSKVGEPVDIPLYGGTLHKAVPVLKG